MPIVRNFLVTADINVIPMTIMYFTRPSDIIVTINCYPLLTQIEQALRFKKLLYFVQKCSTIIQVYPEKEPEKKEMEHLKELAKREESENSLRDLELSGLEEQVSQLRIIVAEKEYGRLEEKDVAAKLTAIIASDAAMEEFIEEEKKEKVAMKKK
ncbi:hypothetical protein K501DRAFT_276246 [Backusella circina FSU 941]|nr:hypothetical protein K501DRAFT_276246 [Backusella circina FSU 941]